MPPREEKNQLADFILNSKKGKDSALGQELLQAAQEIKKEEDEDNDTAELKCKFSKFREFEQKGDVLLISYDSFQRFNEITQKRIKELDNIIWNGVFLVFSQFKERVHYLFQESEDVCFNVEKRGKHYELKILRDAYFDNSNISERNGKAVFYVSLADGVISVIDY